MVERPLRCRFSASEIAGQGDRSKHTGVDASMEFDKRTERAVLMKSRYQNSVEDHCRDVAELLPSDSRPWCLR